MKASLNELKELVVFLDDTNNNIRSSIIRLLVNLILEPMQQGIFEYEGIYTADYVFRNNSDILDGINYLEYRGAEMDEEREFSF